MNEGHEQRGPDVLGWILAILFTGLCLAAAAIQLFGIRQVPF